MFPLVYADDCVFLQENYCEGNRLVVETVYSNCSVFRSETFCHRGCSLDEATGLSACIPFCGESTVYFCDGDYRVSLVTSEDYSEMESRHLCGAGCYSGIEGTFCNGDSPVPVCESRELTRCEDNLLVSFEAEPYGLHSFCRCKTMHLFVCGQKACSPWMNASYEERGL